MEDLFRSYWWLIFPLGWFVASGFSSLLNYRRQKDTLKLIQTYAERGQEPPAALLKVLERPIDADDDAWQTRNQGGRPGDGSWFSVVLFGAMSAGFAYASWSDIYGAGEAFLIVSFVLGALCLADGWSHGEASMALGLPLGTVKSHVARGRARLLKALGGPDDA